VQQHHRDAIARWAEAAADDDEVLVVVVAGSLTKGYGRADSDVDGFLIVTDEAFARRRASGELTVFSTEFCDYEGGYVDAKSSTAPFSTPSLSEVASRPDRRSLGRSWPGRATHRSMRWCTRRPPIPRPASKSAWPASSRRPRPPSGTWARRPSATTPTSPGGRQAGWRCSPAVGCWPTTKCCTPTTSGWCARSLRCPTGPTSSSIWCPLTIERTPAAAEAVVMSLLLFREWPQAPAGWSTQVMLDSE
jgi:hypothetical protein